MPEISVIIKQYNVGFLVDNYSPEKIAEKINVVLNDEKIVSEIKQNQKIAKKTLCWEKESEKLNNYFK